MQFCPKCNSRLKAKQEDEEKTAKMICVKCGYSTTQVEVPKTTSKSKKKPDTKEEPSIKVLEEEDDDVKALPTTNVECPKCSNKEAVWWMLQTRSADEPTTQFYRCTKCSHTWRHYA